MSLHPTTCPLDCPDACGVLVETGANGELLRVRGNPAHLYSRGALCSKTSSYHELVKSPARLLAPLLRDGDGFREVTWDEALAHIAKRMAPIAGPDILALAYAGSMGMLARKFPMRMMHALGATLHDGGVCDATSSAGYAAVLGELIGPNVLEAEDADGIVLWGSDVKRTIQHLFPLVKARAAAGVPVRVIDIYRTETLQAVERWGGRGLVIQPGSDSILALAIARYAFEQGLADRAFLERECLGADEFEQHLQGAPTIAEAASQCGLSEEAILDLAKVLARSKNLFLRTGSGWTRRTNGAMSMRAVCSMAAVFGKADRVHYESGGLFKFDGATFERRELRKEPEPPTLTQVALGEELERGRFRAVFVWGHNPALTLPDSERVRRGFLREDLFLVVHEQFMTATAQLADVVLPATTFIEHSDVYRSYGHRAAQYGRQAVKPPEGPLSNVQTFGRLARAMDLPEECWDTDEDALCEELLASVDGLLNEEQRRTLRAGEPTTMEPPPASRQSAEGGKWLTKSGKVELVSANAAAAGQPAMATWCADPGIGEGRAFWLVSAPSKHTHNTTYLDHPRHAKRNANPRCFIAPSDMEALGLQDGERVTLFNDRGRLTLTAESDDAMPEGSLRVDGFPRPADTPEGTSVNVLTSPAVSDLGNGTTYFSTRVDAQRYEG